MYIRDRKEAIDKVSPNKRVGNAFPSPRPCLNTPKEGIQKQRLTRSSACEGVHVRMCTGVIAGVGVGVVVGEGACVCACV